MSLLAKDVTSQQSKDSGLALVLICLILSQFFASHFFIITSIVLLVIAMSVPVLFQPFAKVWFGFSQALGAVVSKVVLTIIFFLVVFPVSLVRRAMGKDAMKLKAWKQGSHSVFRVREHVFTENDLDHPY